MFRSWLYANLGTLYIVCVLAIIGVLTFTTPILGTSGEVNPEWWVPLFGIGIVSFVLMFSFEPSYGPGFVLLFLVGGYFFIRFGVKSDSDLATDLLSSLNKYVIVSAVLSLVPAIFIARYCYRNFDDIVSRRWLYRNSDKDVFESTWKYTINRFLTSFELILALLLDIGIVWAFKNLDLLEKLL